MSIEWFRDLAVIIFSLVTTVMLVLVAVLGFLVYRRLISILDSFKVTAKTLEDLSGVVREEMGEILQLAAIVRVIMKGIDKVREFFKKGGDKNDQ